MCSKYILPEYKNLGDYKYFEINDCYYYVHHKIFIDKQKNIICNSNCHTYETNKDYLNKVYDNIKNLNLDDNNIIELENIIAIQAWFVTYGHFKDEIFNLCNFYELFNNNNFKAFMNYKKGNGLSYSLVNYERIKNLLFEDNFINASDLNCDIIKIKRLILISHNLNSNMFHMFPQIVTNKILNKITNFNDNYNKNIFITRGKALHLPRNLDNQEELEEYFKSINYNVINPEIIELELFIDIIRNAENIYITWGGAMVNLCYVNKNSNIYLLQSKSYMHENIFTIFKFLKNYSNIYVIKCDDNNKINMNNCIITKL